MSEPPPPTLNPHSTSSLNLLDHHGHHLHPHHHHPPTHTATAATTAINPSSPSSSLAREYRKGNWTLHETLVLITAKRLDDERRTNRVSSSSSSAATAPTADCKSQPQQQCRSAELRWKWVENYCWRNGCLRSQNQCNDKWDNLLRDYKKVRDYEARCDGGKERPSYWAMEKHERKERNLPSNLVAEVYDALTDVLSRRNAHKGPVAAAAQPIASRPPPPPVVPSLPPPPPINNIQIPPQQAPPLTSAVPPPAVVAPPPPPPPPSTHQQPQQSQSSIPETSASSESEGLETDTKRRKKVRDLGSSVVRGASVLARTLLACEEKREKRHRDTLEMEERRLRMEEDRTEMSRKGIAGLIAAVNNLSGAIHALVSDHHHQQHRGDDNTR